MDMLLYWTYIQGLIHNNAFGYYNTLTILLETIPEYLVTIGGTRYDVSIKYDRHCIGGRAISFASNIREWIIYLPVNASSQSGFVIKTNSILSTTEHQYSIKDFLSLMHDSEISYKSEYPLKYIIPFLPENMADKFTCLLMETKLEESMPKT